jgi:hypothetical protein
MKYTNSLKEDCSSRLDDIQRPWLRRHVVCAMLPIGIILIIALIVVLVLVDVVKSIYRHTSEAVLAIKDFLRDCW